MQQNIFDFLKEEYKINKPIRLIELFGGIGCQALALEYLNVDFEHYKLIEFDKYCIQTYNQLHNTNFIPLDITKIKGEDLEIKDTNNYEYILTYSYPCQSLSLAGKQEGMTEGSNTKSSLLWELKRLLNEIVIGGGSLPQVLLMENVTQVHSKKNIEDFKKWINFLENLGYSNYYQDLNAKNYGIPQNRDRTFMVSLLGNYYYEFPKPFKLELRLKDMLEDEVDEKYFLSDKMIEYLTGTNQKESKFPRNERSLQSLKMTNVKGIATTISTNNGNRPVYNVPEATKKGYAVAEEGDGIYINRPHQKRGVVQKGMSQTIKCNANDLGVVVNATHRDKISLKRGYNVEVKKESPGTTEIDVIGNYSKSNYNATQIVGKNGVAPTVRENHGQVTVIVTATRDNLITINNLWTETQANMINADGNVKRYIDSNIIDEFKEGQVADISFPNGYNKGPRVHNECPALNGTTTTSSFIVKVNDKEDKKISLNTNYKKLIGIIEKNVLPIGEVKHMDLYNRNLTDNCGALNDPCHNNNRLWDGLRIRKLTPRECFRLMGIKDESFDKIKNLSNTQAYKQAGNGIVVNVNGNI